VAINLSLAPRSRNIAANTDDCCNWGEIPAVRRNDFRFACRVSGLLRIAILHEGIAPGGAHRLSVDILAVWYNRS
jgi:hypothetical protein